MAAAEGDASALTVNEEIWGKLKGAVYTAQISYFANVKWTTLDDADKLTMAAILNAFYIQQTKHGAKANEVSYPQFCKVLQELEGSDTRVAGVLKSYGDRSSMSAQFKALGFKLRGDTTLIEALCFLFAENTASLTNSDPTPCAAALRERQEEQAAEEAKMAALVAAVEEAAARETAAQEAHKPMDATRARTEKAAAEDAKRGYEMAHRKALKACVKAVKTAEEQLAAEKSAGTEADAWLRGVCEAKHIPYAGW